MQYVNGYHQWIGYMCTDRIHKSLKHKKKNTSNIGQTQQTNSKLECYLALNRKYELSEYLSKVSDPKLRKVLSIHEMFLA